MADIWREMEGKYVYVILRNRKNYSGQVIQIDEREGKTFFTMRDKFGKIVMFPDDEVSVIQEEERR